MPSKTITIRGAGILGLWQAIELNSAGHDVTLVDHAATPFEHTASRYAGAMLAPDCEAEATPAIVRDLGRDAIPMWASICPLVQRQGSIVIAAPRDRSELDRFARMTERHQKLDVKALSSLEPQLAHRFASALYFPDEAHMDATAALANLLEYARDRGVKTHFGSHISDNESEIVVDCTGMGASGQLDDLRGVRGERAIIETDAVRLTRPIRLLHPRHPIYVVPWGNGRFMLGATVIESEDDGPASLRSTLELLGTAYALDPGFAEARIIDIGAGVRPAFPDNVPRVVIRKGATRIFVNGAYRHGFLLAPILARAVKDHLAGNTPTHPLVQIET